jgi:Tfp pilus assembly protein PilZ
MSLPDPEPPSADQRRHQRLRYRDPVQVIPLGGAGDYRPRALLAEDLSDSGLQLSSPELFAVGRRLLLALTLPEVAAAPINLTGRVIWSAQDGEQERFRLGVQFDEVSPTARALLTRLIRRRREAVTPAAGQRLTPRNT